MAMCCSILGDVIFFLASMRVDNRNIHGLVHVYYQHLSYAFCVHLFASATFCAATLCSSVAAYLLVREECEQYGCCNSKQKKQKTKKQSKYFPYVSNINDTNLHYQTNPIS
uniref:CASP-like protein n=1 Tax=Ditylenchus dipsaci TaxID=166011 RepID=A0A915EG93_9BILA